MRAILYIIILALLLFAPVESLDVAKLEPVQTVALYTDGSAIVLKTDTDNKGRGVTVDGAYADLEEKTPGVIYLDTAEYLLVTHDAAIHVDVLRKYLHSSVEICFWDGEGSITDAAQYLSVREDLPKLRDWQLPAKK